MGAASGAGAGAGAGAGGGRRQGKARAGFLDRANPAGGKAGKGNKSSNTGAKSKPGAAGGKAKRPKTTGQQTRAAAAKKKNAGPKTPRSKAAAKKLAAVPGVPGFNIKQSNAAILRITIRYRKRSPCVTAPSRHSRVPLLVRRSLVFAATSPRLPSALASSRRAVLLLARCESVPGRARVTQCGDSPALHSYAVVFVVRTACQGCTSHGPTKGAASEAPSGPGCQEEGVLPLAAGQLWQLGGR